MKEISHEYLILWIAIIWFSTLTVAMITEQIDIHVLGWIVIFFSVIIWIYFDGFTDRDSKGYLSS